ncbi:hypothetical protein GCM10029992_34880 [Glycomyces albus]
MPGTASFCLVVFGGLWLADSGVPVWARGVGAAALVVAGASSLVLLSRRMALPPDAGPGRAATEWLIAGCGSAAVLGVMLLALREYGSWAVVPATMLPIAATYMSPRRRRTLIAVAVVLAPLPGAVISLAAGESHETLHAVLMPMGLFAFIAPMVQGPLWAWDIARRLEEARRLASDLAVKNERLRFAGDLHDIQGHHLQVISLKSELAARLVETDPERAVAEMKETRQMATDALEDTRALVQGYRRTTLDAEIANATGVLAAADIDASTRLDPDHGELEPARRHLLGLVMREATTNMLRHSRARSAEVEYTVADGRACLRVSNDGADPAASTSAGGLRTLADRLEAAGEH